MRGTNAIRTSVLLALFAAAACESGLGSDTIARAGDFRLEVEPVAELLAPANGIPVDSSVVQAVADFWIDYSLLAWVLNEEGEMDALDLTTLVNQQRDRMLVGRLRDSVIQVDTTMTDEELRQMYEETRPADQVRARHVLLGFPENATQAQRDSVRALATEIRDRARAGENFATLAETYSEDPGSAASGGDLGFFGRGMMVAPFDSASFAMEPGEVSDVIETDFGLHVIRLEERNSPAYDEIGYDYRQQVQSESVLEAETFFLDQLMMDANLEMAEGAPARVREITANAEAELTAAEQAEVLATYEGGTYTVGDFQGFVQSQPAELRMQVEMAMDEQLETFIHDLVRDRLLIADAQRRGIEVRPLELQQIELEIKAQFESYGEALQLASIEPQGSETMEEAVSREVWTLLEGVVAGERELLPLGALTVPLRNHYGAEVSPTAVAAASARVAEIRAEEGGEVVVPDIVPPPSPTPGAETPPVEQVPGGAVPPVEPAPTPTPEPTPEPAPTTTPGDNPGGRD